MEEKTNDVFREELEKSNIDEKEIAYYLHDGKENHDRWAIHSYF